ncbi:MAG: PhnD/SsuA/transferrin family substrate-binding protein [Rhodoferax sp.]|uniref:PhnD/SsuA/transferrin family substrate-binding protein n=1 Tax=Rhodoferax sp. TaxID=50421 RepID=UPI00301A6A47
MTLRRRPLVLGLLTALVGCDAREESKAPIYTSAPAVVAGKPVYRLAVHPLHNPQTLHQLYTPLTDYLGRQLTEVHFEVEASTSYADFQDKFTSRGPHLILPNPYHALKAADNGYEVIAEAGNSADFRGIFLLRKDSGITSPLQLKGKTVAFPAPTALAAAMMPMVWLANQGLKMPQDIQSSFVGTHQSAILNVYLGQAAAGVTWPSPWNDFQKSNPKEAAALHLVWQTPELINNALMARSDLPPHHIARIRELLLGLHEHEEGQAILKGMMTPRFNPADTARYRHVVGGFLKTYIAQVGPLP